MDSRDICATALTALVVMSLAIDKWMAPRVGLGKGGQVAIIVLGALGIMVL
jgi:hypothetical protein